MMQSPFSSATTHARGHNDTAGAVLLHYLRTLPGVKLDSLSIPLYHPLGGAVRIGVYQGTQAK